MNIYILAFLYYMVGVLFWNTLYDVSGLWLYNSVVTADLF